jgi:hypothetical protein
VSCGVLDAWAHNGAAQWRRPSQRLWPWLTPPRPPLLGCTATSLDATAAATVTEYAVPALSYDPALVASKDVCKDAAATFAVPLTWSAAYDSVSVSASAGTTCSMAGSTLTCTVSAGSASVDVTVTYGGGACAAAFVPPNSFRCPFAIGRNQAGNHASLHGCTVTDRPWLLELTVTPRNPSLRPQVRLGGHDRPAAHCFRPRCHRRQRRPHRRRRVPRRQRQAELCCDDSPGRRLTRGRPGGCRGAPRSRVGRRLQRDWQRQGLERQLHGRPAGHLRAERHRHVCAGWVAFSRRFLLADCWCGAPGWGWWILAAWPVLFWSVPRRTECDVQASSMTRLN